MKHYVYKLTDPETGQYYYGSRSCEIESENDDYMGSMKTWKPEDTSRLVKEIIKDDFETREEAIEFESKIIEENIDDKLNENYYIPNKGFHNFGKVGYWAGKKRPNHSDIMKGRTFTNSHKNKIRNSRIGKSWEDIYGKEEAHKLKNKISQKYTGKGNPMYGVVPSEDRIDKQRTSLKEYYTKNIHPMLGKVHSSDVKEKISKSHSKKVIHIESGKIFDSQLEAANYFSLDNSTISYHCLGKAKTKKFKFI